MADKINATLKVYYLFNGTKCLARGGTVSATPIAQGADVATIDLRTCALAVCSSSPELIGDKNTDYSIYTLDATEGIDGDLYEGQGLLSWGLSQPPRLAKPVSGFVKPSLSGTVLEVRMKLSQVLQSSQQEFITSMQSFERISRTLPATFDYSNWTEFMKQANNGNVPPTNQSKSAQRNPSGGQITTLQRARELAARQTPHSMSAQLKSARQQQSTQQRHARLIAQQAAATPHNNSVFPGQSQQPQQSQSRRADSQEGDGPLPDPASPQLPTPSSPPQMKTFAPPPALPMRSNSMPMAIHETNSQAPQLARFTSTGAPVARQDLTPRGLKRKASDLDSFDPTNRPRDFSPSKALNAAKNKVGAVQQLFKSRSPRDPTQSPGPTVLDKLQQIRDGPDAESHLALPTSGTVAKDDPLPIKQAAQKVPVARPQRNDADLLKALEEGQPIKFCYNCGNIQTKGNWRQLTLDGAKHSLCNACGVYWKTKNKMRPEKLWKRDKSDMDFPSKSSRILQETSSQYQTPLPSDGDHMEHRHMVQTSPLKGGEHSTFQQRARETRSSPAPSKKRSIPRSDRMLSHSTRHNTPPRETLQELQVNTPQPPPSPSPASGTGLEDLVALLQTPKKSFSSKMLSSPSPWRSMFTLLDDVQKDGPESPSRQKLDKFLEDLGMTGGPGSMNFDFASIANFPLSPLAQGNLDSLASFMSSPPAIFTSSAGLENDNSTPEDLDQPLPVGKSPSRTHRTPEKRQDRTGGGGDKDGTSLEEGDSLFTPRKHNTRSRPGSVQRSLRSAGAAFGEQMFGAALS